MTTNAVGNDEWVGIDDICVDTAGCRRGDRRRCRSTTSPSREGDAGTTTFDFTVSLSAPAPAGGVTFDIATADGTRDDRRQRLRRPSSLTGQTIAEGSATTRST